MKKIIIPLSLILTIILSAINPLIYRFQNRGYNIVDRVSIGVDYETQVLNEYSDFSLEIFSNAKYFPAYPNGVVRIPFINDWRSDDTKWHYSRYIEIGDFRLRIPKNIKYEPVREKSIQFENKEYKFSYNGQLTLDTFKFSSVPGVTPGKACITSWRRNWSPEDGENKLITWDDNIISLTVPIDPSLRMLENRDEVTEQLAKEYFNKYAGTLIYTATDEHSEYRLSPENEDTPFRRLISEYNDTPTYSNRDTVSYYFRKYIDGTPSYETVKITFDFSNKYNAILTIENTDSAPLLSSDVIDLYSNELTDVIEAEIEHFYLSKHEAIYGKIVSIDSSERYLAKSMLGARGVVSNVIVEFENCEEKALIQTYTMLESPFLYAYYTYIPYIIVQTVLSAAIIFLIVFIIVKKIRKKKLKKLVY